MRASILCVLGWRYDSAGVVAYLSLKSPSGTELTLARPQFHALPKAMLERIRGFLAPVAIPGLAEREAFKGELKAHFSSDDMRAFQAAHAAALREGAA